MHPSLQCEFSLAQFIVAHGNLSVSMSTSEAVKRWPTTVTRFTFLPRAFHGDGKWAREDVSYQGKRAVIVTSNGAEASAEMERKRKLKSSKQVSGIDMWFEMVAYNETNCSRAI